MIFLVIHITDKLKNVLLSIVENNRDKTNPHDALKCIVDDSFYTLRKRSLIYYHLVTITPKTIINQFHTAAVSWNKAKHLAERSRESFGGQFCLGMSHGSSEDRSSGCRRWRAIRGKRYRCAMKLFYLNGNVCTTRVTLRC